MSTTLVNAVPVEVTYRDGRKETITLAELSIRQLYVFIKHLGSSDTPALVALSAGKPADWVDTLSDESFDALTAAAIKLNFARAVARGQSDPVAAATLGPLLISLVDVVQKLQTNGSSGNISLPAPVVLASAEATGSGSLTAPPGA